VTSASRATGRSLVPAVDDHDPADGWRREVGGQPEGAGDTILLGVGKRVASRMACVSLMRVARQSWPRRRVGGPRLRSIRGALPSQKITSGKPQRDWRCQVDVGVAEVGDRRQVELVECGRDAEAAGGHLFEKLMQVGRFHRGCSGTMGGLRFFEDSGELFKFTFRRSDAKGGAASAGRVGHAARAPRNSGTPEARRTIIALAFSDRVRYKLRPTHILDGGSGGGLDMGAGVSRWRACGCWARFQRHRLFQSGQPSAQRDFSKAQRAAIKEVRLFMSANEGRTWDLVSSIYPEKGFFVFNAPRDGYYWLRVASVNQQDVQEPANIQVGPPDQKMIIDTVKPIVRSLQAKRQGAEIVVSWESPGRPPRRWVVPSGGPAQGRPVGALDCYSGKRGTDRAGALPGRQRPGDGSCASPCATWRATSRSRLLKFPAMA